MTTLYDFEISSLQGKELDLAAYKGKVVLVVNTASKCGLTPQYEGLQALYEKYQERGLVILGAPCNQFANQEPGDAGTIEGSCLINYGVKWNFTKFLVGKDGVAIKRFAPTTKPENIVADIEAALAA